MDKTNIIIDTFRTFKYPNMIKLFDIPIGSIFTINGGPVMRISQSFISHNVHLISLLSGMASIQDGNKIINLKDVAKTVKITVSETHD